ncbi:MAG: flagellar hook-length control protein FliK [Pseudomonadota bacterium]
MSSTSSLSGDGLANDGRFVDVLDPQVDGAGEEGALDDRILSRAETRAGLFSGPLGSRLRLGQTGSAVQSISDLSLTTIAPLAAQPGEVFATLGPEFLQTAAQTTNYSSQLQQSILLSQDVGSNPNLPTANRALDSSGASLLNAFQDIRFSGQQEKERVVIQLDPPELGRVSLDFKFDGSTVTSISVTSENPEALKRLREYQFELMNALAERGLSGGNLTYHQNSSNQNSQSENSLDLSIETEKSTDIYNSLPVSEQGANTHIQPNSRHLNLSL